MGRDAVYIHGTEPAEQARLRELNRLTNPPFRAFLNLAATDHVLEVGSGLGILLAELAAEWPQAHFTGIELSPDQLALARQHQRPNLVFLQGDAHRLPFPDQSFAVAYCRYLLEHVGAPVDVLKEMRRVLKPGGRALAQENNIAVNEFHPPCPHFAALWGKFATLQARLGGDALIGKRLLPLFQAAGFRDIVLSIQPEVHWSGSPGFPQWIANLIGNIRSGAASLQEQGLATASEVGAAVQELEQFAQRDDAAAFFYWNRAEGWR